MPPSGLCPTQMKEVLANHRGDGENKSAKKEKTA
jgi:hypothetical protein